MVRRGEAELCGSGVSNHSYPVCPGLGGCSHLATCAFGKLLLVTSASIMPP